MEGTGLEGQVSADQLDTRTMIAALTGAVGRMSRHSPGESIYRYVNRMVLPPPGTVIEKRGYGHGIAHLQLPCVAHMRPGFQDFHREGAHDVAASATFPARHTSA